MTCLGILLGLGVLAALILIGLAWNTLFYRHQRAYQRWQSHQPDHYRYQATIEKLFFTRTWQVEVQKGQVVSMIEIQPANAGDNQAWIKSASLAPLTVTDDTGLIEPSFAAIRSATIAPGSPAEFMARVNPRFYQDFHQGSFLPGGWTACNPAFPRVRYHPVYGYPQEAFLYGLPCFASLELGSPASIKIENFQPLP